MRRGNSSESSRRMSGDDQWVNRAQEMLMAEPLPEGRSALITCSKLAPCPRVSHFLSSDKDAGRQTSEASTGASGWSWHAMPMDVHSPTPACDGGLNDDTLMVFSTSSSPSDVPRVDRAGAPDLQVRPTICGGTAAASPRSTCWIFQKGSLRVRAANVPEGVSKAMSLYFVQFLFCMKYKNPAVCFRFNPLGASKASIWLFS